MVFTYGHPYRILTFVAVILSIAVVVGAETPHFPPRIPIVERPFSG